MGKKIHKSTREATKAAGDETLQQEYETLQLPRMVLKDEP